MKFLISFNVLLAVLFMVSGCADEALSPVDSDQAQKADNPATVFSKAAGTAEYEITLENLTPATGPGASQPFSPPVVVTHRPPLRLFKVNDYASDELRYIAEDALNDPLLTLLGQSGDVHEVVVGGGVIFPGASASYTIHAERGSHKLSLVSMLVNTNDAFTGADKINLQVKGTEVYYLNAYDAGTELNTELADHIPGPCCNNPMVRVPTNERISQHPGIQGSGDLDQADYGWQGSVAKLTITRVN